VSPETYPPSEDTYLLLDAVEATPDDTMLEMGCGSGYITVNLCSKVRRGVAIDIQLDAVKDTIRNLNLNDTGSNCSVIQSNLFHALHKSARFSIIIFNPPYLPGGDEPTTLDPALVGGNEGIELTENFLVQSIPHLETNGSLYVIASSLANIEYLEQVMVRLGLDPARVSEESLFFEKLVVLRGVLEK
jgi:release factor glutamine methyltransferase